MMATILTLCGTTMMLTSCSTSDNPTEVPLTPEMRTLQSQITGVWVDTANVAFFGYGNLYEFSENGNLTLVRFTAAENYETNAPEDDDILATFYQGKWKVIDNIKDRWFNSGEKFVGIEIEKTAEGSSKAVRDTLFVDVDDNNNFIFLSASEIDFILKVYGKNGNTQVNATRRASFWDVVWKSLKNVTQVVNDKVIKPTIKKTNEKVNDLIKKIKDNLDPKRLSPEKTIA